MPLSYRGSGGRGPSRERTCYPRIKLSPVSVHSSLVELHFAEKETGDHFSCFPIQKDARKHGFREKEIICNFVFFQLEIRDESFIIR